MSHGAGKYRTGCRCRRCKQGHAIVAAEARRRAAQRTPPEHVHGTLTGYTFWSCRCDACRAIKSADNRRRRTADSAVLE